MAQCTQSVHDYGCILFERHGHIELTLSRFPTNLYECKQKEKLDLGYAGNQHTITVTKNPIHEWGWGGTRGREWHYVTLQSLEHIQVVGILCWYGLIDLWTIIFRPIRTRGNWAHLRHKLDREIRPCKFREILNWRQIQRHMLTTLQQKHHFVRQIISASMAVDTLEGVIYGVHDGEGP